MCVLCCCIASSNSVSSAPTTRDNYANKLINSSTTSNAYDSMVEKFKNPKLCEKAFISACGYAQMSNGKIIDKANELYVLSWYVAEYSPTTINYRFVEYLKEKIMSIRSMLKMIKDQNSCKNDILNGLSQLEDYVNEKWAQIMCYNEQQSD